MTGSISSTLDIPFLRWLREQTEDAWQSYQTKSFNTFKASGIGGYDWQQGTRWLGGLPEEDISRIEKEQHFPFPPDYRLFLQILHCVDRPRVGAVYAPDGVTMLPATSPSFFNWLSDTAELQAAYNWLLEGLLFDVEYNHLWLETWGKKPDTSAEQVSHIEELVSQAPPLIPIFGHRYLLAEPCQAGNPILSIYQSDIIIYSLNIHDFFLKELAQLLPASPLPVEQLTDEQFNTYQNIPFWGPLLS
jgi:hypothetical protein